MDGRSLMPIVGFKTLRVTLSLPSVIERCAMIDVLEGEDPHRLVVNGVQPIPLAAGRPKSWYRRFVQWPVQNVGTHQVPIR